MTLLDLPRSRRRSAGIDLLRGVLAVWVLLSHAQGWAVGIGSPSKLLNATVGNLSALFQSNGQTHPAVIGFIVLSGYCIHLGGFRRSGGSLLTYALRRFFRIWPVYALASIFGIAAFFVSKGLNAPLAIAFTGTSEISLGCIAAKVTGVSAFIPALHQCSFEGNAPLTTVMVEMWLYAVYAAAVFLFFRRGFGNAFLFIVGGIFIFGVTYVSWNPVAAGWWDNGSLPGFLAYWWIGAAFVSERISSAAKRLWLPLALVWLAIALLLTTHRVHAFGLIQIQQILLALLFGAVIVAIDRFEGVVLGPVAAIGRAGYSLYAFHAPVLILVLIASGSWWVASLTAIASGLVLFRIYEQPLDRLGQSIAKAAAPSLESVDSATGLLKESRPAS